MRPILFEIFGWGVPSWHFFFVLAAFSAFFIARFCARWACQSAPHHSALFLEKLPHLFIICYLAGWFGARALSIAVEQLDVRGVTEFISALFQIGPMTFYGGALAAILCGVFYCQLCRISLPFALDCGVLGGVVALGLGRIGCHLNGDDYGLPVSEQANPPWWSVRYFILEDGGVYRYPVQLEEAFASFLIFIFGWHLFRKTYRATPCPATAQSSIQSANSSGQTAAWVGLMSSTHRYINEIFRGDPRGFFPGTQISTSSGIALLIVVFCVICLVRIRLRPSLDLSVEKMS